MMTTPGSIWNEHMHLWLEIVLRTLTAVLFLLLLTKVLGKRQVTELSVFECITGITIGNLAGYVSLEARIIGI
ncbi:hypothetical protein [Paenibacillus sacheonensis]|uniref:hypothetical protein n=1 Tax=Paenibacillus sacheonensis TaxID=742054 RepID=UPI0030842DCA